MPGGTRSFEMARRLVAAGHEVHLITSQRESNEYSDWHRTNEEGISVHWYPVAYSNHMGFFHRLFAFIKFAIASSCKAASIKADVVFATSTPLTIVLPGIYASWRQKVPMVFEVRDMWPAVPIAMGILKNPLLVSAAIWLERLAYRRAKHIVALAPGMRDDVVSSGVDSAKVTVIPNGCDLNVFASDLATPAIALRESLPWLGSRSLVLFAGTLGRANGVDYLVKVAEYMGQIDPEVRFAIIGDGAAFESIKSEAVHSKVLNNNLFMFNAIPKSELAVWLAAADFTVGLFSGPKVLWKDAVQNKFFDSLAAGKPIACNFSGFQSILAVQHDVGLIVDPHNPGLAAVQLHEKLTDTIWLASVKERAKALAEGQFNRDMLAKDLERVLISVL